MLAMRLVPNRFGLAEALVGFAVGLVLASLGVAAFGVISGHPHHPGTFGSDVTSLLVEWFCWIAAALYASSLARRGPPSASRPEGSGGVPAAQRARAATLEGPGRAGEVSDRALPVTDKGRGPLQRALARLRDDYGLSLRPWPDIPLGIVLGVASQYLLVPLLELPLLPFVPHLFRRLGGPADQLTAGASGASLAVLGLLVCVGSPLVEELFFRGLLLRAVAGRFEKLTGPARSAVPVLLVGAVFGLAHFEALQLIGLVGFGVVLGTLAWRTGRLGPGIVAHAAFNTVTIVALALSR
jgi:membrane protease YdiL (CAAX protease family)